MALLLRFRRCPYSPSFTRPAGLSFLQQQRQQHRQHAHQHPQLHLEERQQQCGRHPFDGTQQQESLEEQLQQQQQQQQDCRQQQGRERQDSCRQLLATFLPPAPRCDRKAVAQKQRLLCACVTHSGCCPSNSSSSRAGRRHCSGSSRGYCSIPRGSGCCSSSPGGGAGSGKGGGSSCCVRSLSLSSRTPHTATAAAAAAPSTPAAAAAAPSTPAAAAAAPSTPAAAAAAPSTPAAAAAAPSTPAAAAAPSTPAAAAAAPSTAAAAAAAPSIAAAAATAATEARRVDEEAAAAARTDAVQKVEKHTFVTPEFAIERPQEYRRALQQLKETAVLLEHAVSFSSSPPSPASSAAKNQQRRTAQKEAACMRVWPSLATTYADMGLLLHQQGDLREAAASYRKALQVLQQQQHAAAAAAKEAEGGGRAAAAADDATKEKTKTAELQHRQRASAAALDAAVCLSYLGVVEADRGNLKTAEHHLLQSLRTKLALLHGVTPSCNSPPLQQQQQREGEVEQQQEQHRQERTTTCVGGIAAEVLSPRRLVEGAAAATAATAATATAATATAATATAATATTAEAGRKLGAPGVDGGAGGEIFVEEAGAQAAAAGAWVPSFSPQQQQQLRHLPLRPHGLYFDTLNSLGGLWLRTQRLRSSLLALLLAEQCMYTLLPMYSDRCSNSSSDCSNSSGRRSVPEADNRADLPGSTLSEFSEQEAAAAAAPAAQQQQVVSAESEAAAVGGKAGFAGHAAALQQLGSEEEYLTLQRLLEEADANSSVTAKTLVGQQHLPQQQQQQQQSRRTQQQQQQLGEIPHCEVTRGEEEQQQLTNTTKKKEAEDEEGDFENSADIPHLRNDAQFAAFHSALRSALPKTRQDAAAAATAGRPGDADGAAAATAVRAPSSHPRQQQQNAGAISGLPFYGTVVFYNIGQTYYLLGKAEEAARALQRAHTLARLSGDFELQNRVLLLLQDMKNTGSRKSSSNNSRQASSVQASLAAVPKGEAGAAAAATC